MPTTLTSRSASRSNTARWALVARVFLVGCFAASLSACAAQPHRASAARAPQGGGPVALTLEPTDVIHGQRPAEGLPRTPSIRRAMANDRADEVSRQEVKNRQAAASAALGRAGRIGSKSIGQSARWSSLNH